MPDLRLQLREYVEDTIERVDVEDVAVAIDGPSPRRSVVRTPAFVFAAAAVAFLVVIGGTAWLLRGSGSSPAEEVTTTSLLQSTTSAPASTTAIPELDASPTGVWQRATSDGLGGEGEQYAWNVIEYAGGFIAVGQSSEPDSSENAAVWRSNDGYEWTPTGVAGLAETGHQAMYGITFLGEQAIAVGRHDDEDGAVAAVWRSTDGSSWERVLHDDAVFGPGGHQWMWSVTAAGPGVVAVGHQGSFDDRDVAIWYSTDGQTWHVSPSEEDLAVPGHQVMIATAATEGVVVAAGYDARSGDRDAAIWISTDGVDWQQVESSDLVAPGDQQIMGITATSTGFVAVGYDGASGDWDAAVWTSPDGLNWSRMNRHEALGGDGDQIMNAIAETSDGFVAVGSITRDGLEQPAVWTTDDGVAWMLVDPDTVDASGGCSSVALTPTQITTVGYTVSDTDADAAVWTTPPQD